MKSSERFQSQVAVVCLLFSASLWGMIWYPLRLLNDAGMSAVWSSLVMYFAAAICVLPVFFKQYKLIITIRYSLLVLALASGITNVAFAVALIEGEVMRVLLLFYLSPLWSVLLSRWWLGENLSRHAVIMLCIAMAGSIIMLWNPLIGWPWPQGSADWLALTAGIAFSVNNVMARKLASIPMSIKSSAIWYGVVLVSLCILVWQDATIPDVSAYVWASAWLLGWLGIIVMTAAVLYGISKMPVYRSSVIMLFELVVASIGAWWLTNEVMSLQEWLGGGLILLAAYGVARA